MSKSRESYLQKFVKSFEEHYGKSDIVYKTESEMYEEYCDENGLL